LFCEVAREAKKTPGPCNYNAHLGKDKFVLKRIPGSYKR